jgi:ribose transport system substrate-binding protein
VKVLISPEHWLKGYIATKLLAAHAEHGTAIPKGTWDTGGLVVDSSNIDAITQRQASDAAMLKALGPVGDKQIAESSQYVK